MNKFSGPESSEYVKVRGFIEKYWTESEEVLGRHDLRKVLFRVPVARTENFVGRKDFLEELLKVLLPQKSSETCQLITINGLEGVGKTEVAIEAAYRVKEREDEKCSVFWISAATKEDFESDYRDIGKDLGVDSFSGDIVSLVNKQLNKRPGRWLLIIDDVDDTKNWKLERGSLPTGQNGSILVTTGDRRISARLGGEGKLLEALSNEEAIELLKRPLTDDHIGDDNQAKKLVNFLDRLPLAITLASRYMGLNGISVREYLDLWETRDKKMIQQLCEGSERGGQHGRSSKSSEQAVAETWLISFDRIIKYPKFLGCLRKLAFYGQQKIPRVMLESEGGQDVDDVIRELLAYSFVTKRPNSDLIEVHQLVQLAMRNWLSQRKEFDEGATSAIERLVKSLPFPTPHNRRKWDYMLPHAEEALGFEDDTVYDDAVWRLLYMVGQANFLLNKHERAEAFHRRALKLEELKILRNPSEAPDLRRQGKYEQAEKEYRKAIAEEKENHMDEHPSITTRKKNTACTFFIQGKYEEARVGYQEVLNIEKETLGENHPSTISTMDSLALVLKSLDECGEAENMYKRVLELKEKSPGEHDLSIIASMENLAIMYQHNRKYQKAEGLHERALQLKESVLGEKHPSTLASRDSLALMLERRGEYKEAGSMYRRTLELKRKTWSDSHPSTRRTRVSLALMEEYERESGIKSEGGRTSIHTKG
ncbi:hypothetical protein FQN54_006491 [Arachnomyces sp. PD_36]|nr:hypothetical protein FQN54_006491 [Arachnomyces sp. PD_36]